MGDADLGLIEGNVGLFDATDLEGSNSNAELAKLLEAPRSSGGGCPGYVARSGAPAPGLPGL